jgi:FkbM family methyltransferase
VKKPSNKKNPRKGKNKSTVDNYLNEKMDIPSSVNQPVVPIDIDEVASKESIINQMLENSEIIDLSTAKANWYFGEWQALIDIDIQAHSNHPDVNKLAALKASAYQQLNDIDKSETYYKLAKDLGCDNYLISQLLIAGVHNSLGKVAALKKDDDKMLMHFDEAVNIGNNTQENKLARQARSVKEISKLGLLPQAAKLLTTENEALDNLQIRPSEQQAQLKILKSEVEIINHELMLAYQKSQMYSNYGTATPVINEDGSVNIERLKQLSPSQLGQDLWVLEQTNFKRDGFFVEFGATDGVLLSNSYLLEKEFGWEGLCSEPNPKYFKQLQKNRNCTVSNACIAGITGEKVEFILANEYGGIADYAHDDNHAEKRTAYANNGDLITLSTVSLHDFLVKNNAPKNIDYMSIDTEGSEFNILKSFPFENWNVKLFSIEHNFTSNRELIKSLLESHNYQRVEMQFDDWYFLKPVD